MCGIPITRLISPHTNESISPPPSDASNASANATAALIAAVRSPSRMLKESPATVRFSIFRPIQSVPNSPPVPGGRFFLAKSTCCAASSQTIPSTVTRIKKRREIPSSQSVFFLMPYLLS